MKKKYILFIVLLFIHGISLFAQDFDFYISDATGNKVYKFDSNGENGEIFISTNLNWPQDILFLEDQNIVLISNLNSNQITKYNANSGEYEGIFASGLGGPTRMKIRNDTLYVLKWGGNGRVAMLDLDGNALGDFTNFGVPLSIGFDWDEEGSLYVSSYGQGGSTTFIRKFNNLGVDQGNFIGNNILAGPTNIWFDPNGTNDLMVLDYNAGALSRFNQDGQFVENIAINLQLPEGIDFDALGNFYIGNGGIPAPATNGSVKMYDSDGNFIKNIISSGSAGLQTPNAIRIRNKTISSNSNIKIEEKNFIIPSIGTQFFIDSNLAMELESIEIYNTAGNLLKKGTILQNEIWNASSQPNGIYLIRSITKKGVFWTQKVMVNN